MPGKYLVLKPENYEIVAVSDAYLDATMTRRADLLGRALFEVFPANPSESDADGVQNIQSSLARVVALGLTDILPVQRYPIRRPASSGGEFEERFWSTVNTPVKGPDGQISFIINRVEDVTDLVRSRTEKSGEIAALQQFDEERGRLDLDILLRAQELNSANERLLEKEANLRTAQRLLRIGVWKLNMETGALTWSDDVYELYGVSKDEFGHTFESYVELVVPDDRSEMRSRYEQFESSSELHFEFEHRVETNGRVARVRGVGGGVSLTATCLHLAQLGQGRLSLGHKGLPLSQGG